MLGRWGVSAAILVSYLVLALQADLRLAVPLLTAITALVTLLLCICLYAGGQDRWCCTPGHLLVVAILIRAMFVFRPAELSDDIFRYLWDGLRLLAGRNPYALAPIAVSPDGGMPSGLLALINHPHLTTIYPPAAQLVFAAGASLKAGIAGLKALLVLFDLLTCILLMRLLRVLQRPTWTAVIYAWHPLPVLEIAASGHVDGAGLLFLLVAVYLLIRQSDTHRHTSCNSHRWCRPFFSGLAFCLAVLTKLFPLVCFPGLLILAGRSRWKCFCLGAAGGTLLLLLPFCPDIRHAWTPLILYARTWEFSGFLYRLLASTPLSGIQTRWLLGMVYVGVMLIAYRSIGTQRASVPNLFRVFYILSLVFLLLTPTLHPWYALTLSLFLPFSAGPGGLVLSWAVLLAYRVLIPFTLLDAWVEDDRTALMIFAAPVVAWLLALLARHHRTAGTPFVSGRMSA